MEKIIEIQNLTKKYGKARGIENINLDIEKGVTYGFIGPNGAGKSTTIKCIMNFINQNSGNVYINKKLVCNKNYKQKEDIGYLPSEINLYEDLTVKKIFEYSASFYKKDCKNKTNDLIKRLEIDVNKKIDELSLGNLKKVGIVLALMHNPQFIIMDEPTSGLDPLMQETFYNILEEEKKLGKTIFFSSHVLSEIKRICDRVVIIKNGKIIKTDDINSFEEDELVKVSIKSDEIYKIKENLNLEKIENESNNEIEFIYKEDTNKLIKILSNYNISKLYIQELDIEDIFMHYYK